MKRIIIYIFLLLGFAISVTAHTQSIRKVYMWDVTLSMKGKAKGCPNIWNDVKKAIIKEIEYINDQSVDIVIVPFQHEVLKSDIRKEYATPRGKLNLIRFIEEYEIPKLWVGNVINGYADTNGNGTTIMTALYAPIKYCLDYITLPDKINFLEFMTDGVSDFEDDKNKFLELVRRWCTVAETKNLYAFYVMLTLGAENKIIMKESMSIRQIWNSKGTLSTSKDISVDKLYRDHADLLRYPHSNCGQLSKRMISSGGCRSLMFYAKNAYL